MVRVPTKQRLPLRTPGRTSIIPSRSMLGGYGAVSNENLRPRSHEAQPRRAGTELVLVGSRVPREADSRVKGCERHMWCG